MSVVREDNYVFAISADAASPVAGRGTAVRALVTLLLKGGFLSPTGRQVSSTRHGRVSEAPTRFSCQRTCLGRPDRSRSGQEVAHGRIRNPCLKLDLNMITGLGYFHTTNSTDRSRMPSAALGSCPAPRTASWHP